MRARGATLFLTLGAALMLAQAGVRIALVWTGNFYWDDVIVIGQASANSILSPDFLAQNHDGHFMPAAFFVAGLANTIAPLNWVVPAVILVVLSALAAAAVGRLLTIMVGGAGMSRRHLVALAAFAFYLFSPMTVPAFVWWSAGLNSLPLQAAMAWIIGDALLLCAADVGDRRRRVIVVRSAIVLLIGLMFFEKAMFIVPVAFGASVLWLRWRLPAPASVPDAEIAAVEASDAGRHRHRRIDADTEPHHGADLPPVPATPLTIAFVGARSLWAALAALTAVWAVIFLSVTDAASGGHSLTQTAKLVWRSVNSALVPGLLGGPWWWDRWNPSPPMADAPSWLIGLGWAAVVAVSIFVAYRVRGAIPVIACAAIYVVGAQVPVMWNRSAVTTALELAQTMRYLPDAAVVLAVAIVLVAISPPRRDDDSCTAAQPASSQPTAVQIAMVAGMVAVLTFSSLWTTASFGRSWHDNPTGAYLANGRAAFAEHPDIAMFDQAVPLEVLLPVTYPDNQISRVFGGLRHPPTIVTSTSALSVLDTSGRLVPGGVTGARLFDAGSGTCRRPEVRGPSRIRLTGPLVRWRWTVALSYCANTAGAADLRLGDGAPVEFLVDAGLHVVYVQLDGSGSALQLTPRTPGLTMHTGAGRVGEVAEARLLG